MAKIVKPGISWVGYEVTCGFCTCRFQIEENDVRLFNFKPSVICPSCRAPIPLTVPAALSRPFISEQERLIAAGQYQRQLKLRERPDRHAHDPGLSGDLWSNSGPISAAPKRCPHCESPAFPCPCGAQQSGDDR